MQEINKKIFIFYEKVAINTGYTTKSLKKTTSTIFIQFKSNYIVIYAQSGTIWLPDGTDPRNLGKVMDYAWLIIAKSGLIIFLLLPPLSQPVHKQR